MHETSKHATTFDRDERDKDDGLRVMAADIAPTALPQSAESVAIYQSDEDFAERVLSDMAIEKELVHGARAQGLKVRARRQSEKAAYLSRTFRRKVGLPSLALPGLETRQAMSARLEEELSLVTAARAVPVEERTDEQLKMAGSHDVAYESFIAWHHLIHGTYGTGDEDVPEEWLDLWANYDADATETMMMLLAGGNEKRVSQFVAGVVHPVE